MSHPIRIRAFTPRVALAAVLAAACNGVPTPHLPQVEQAGQAMHGGGERLRAHQRCVAATHNAEDLVTCMEAEGYHFIERSPEYPADQCWDLRDQPEGELPPPHCFEHAADAPH